MINQIKNKLDESYNLQTGSTDIQTYYLQLLKLLAKTPQLVEQYSEPIVILFLNFIKKYDEIYQDKIKNDKNEEKINILTKKSINEQLIHFLEIFSNIKNYSKIYQQQKLKEQFDR